MQPRGAVPFSRRMLLVKEEGRCRRENWDSPHERLRTKQVRTFPCSVRWNPQEQKPRRCHPVGAASRRMGFYFWAHDASTILPGPGMEFFNTETSASVTEGTFRRLLAAGYSDVNLRPRRYGALLERMVRRASPAASRTRSSRSLRA
jgi:hypothetical protein